MQYAASVLVVFFRSGIVEEEEKVEEEKVGYKDWKK